MDTEISLFLYILAPAAATFPIQCNLCWVPEKSIPNCISCIQFAFLLMFGGLFLHPCASDWENIVVWSARYQANYAGRIDTLVQRRLAECRVLGAAGTAWAGGSAGGKVLFHNLLLLQHQNTWSLWTESLTPNWCEVGASPCKMFSFHVLPGIQRLVNGWTSVYRCLLAMECSGVRKFYCRTASKYKSWHWTKTGEVLMSDHNVHKKSQTVIYYPSIDAEQFMTLVHAEGETELASPKAMIDGMYGRVPPKRKATKGNTLHQIRPRGWWFSFRSFELLMSERCSTVYSILSLELSVLRCRSQTSSNRFCNCWPSWSKHHLFFAMLRWILLPLAVAISDDAECDSPGMMQLKGVPSRQGSQPTSRRKFTPDVWAPKFETSNSESSRLQMDCQGVAWFTLMICDICVVCSGFGILASPTL